MGVNRDLFAIVENQAFASSQICKGGKIYKYI